MAPPVEIEDLPVGIPDIALVSANGPQLDLIPSAAVAAYQRAAGVLGGADKRCHLEWTLVAAVGQVVTAHGTTDGGQLDEQGLLRPKLTGKALRGRDGKRVPDSDAGRLDGDGRYDRPVGPLQLSPATWAVVGVDSDGDGKRNPHDIDDAALAVSVLLCSGTDDLRKRAGRVAGVRRINDDRSFIETVLAVDRAYRVQMSKAYDTVPIVVPNDVPTDLPLDARTVVPTDEPSDDPNDPTLDPSPTDHVTPLPTPTQAQPPRDPTDLPDPSCSPDDPEPTEPDAELTDAPATEPVDAPTDAPSEDETDETEDPGDVPTDLPTDDKPGCEQ